MLSTRWCTPLADLVLPRVCAGCGASGSVLCARCVPRRAPVTAAVDGLDVAVVAAGDYAGGLRTAIVAYKERGRRDAAGPLADLLGAAVRMLPAGVLVAVPSSDAAVRERGGNHLDRVVRRAARRTGLPVAAGALRLTRTVRDSSGLGRVEREANLAGAFRALVPPTAGRGGRWPALVVDDIVTSGATAREAVRALRAAGWPVAGVAAIAVTPRATAEPTRVSRDSPGMSGGGGLPWF